MDGIKCSMCGEGGHRVSRCPDLCDPLKEGFFQGGGGGGGGCDDEHDDQMKLDRHTVVAASTVLRRTWKAAVLLKAQYSLHAGSYDAQRHSAVRCRA